jgi:hypothetical protein
MIVSRPVVWGRVLPQVLRGVLWAGVKGCIQAAQVRATAGGAVAGCRQ